MEERTTIKIDFAPGEFVFLKTDTQQLQRIVIEASIGVGNNTSYVLASGTESSRHYSFEITRERNVLAILN